MSTKPVMTIPFATIERQFELGAYWWGHKWCPAVDKEEDGGGYSIRVVKTETRRGVAVSTTYDYFELDSDGMVLIAPRGYARDFKPGRITGLDEAVTKYAEPTPDAVRFSLGF